jgi:hypothetical protein
MINSIIVNVLWKRIISCLWVHAGARTDIGEKSIKVRCVTFQNLVHNSCNTFAGGPYSKEGRLINGLDCWVHNTSE